MDRVFLDANVLVSAALTPGSSLHELWGHPNVRLLASPYVVDEARRNVTQQAAVDRLEQLLSSVVLLPSEPAVFDVEGATELPQKDLPVMCAAIVCQADYLMTGDQRHFGSLMGRSLGGVRIVTPRLYLRP
ncbi:MAG: PIN domain-containing protein [Coriobacteriales bacterium]|nr:PIN domain-containing protein [Coriobacteriales bacterium]